MIWTPEDAQAIKAIFEPLFEPLVARMDSFQRQLDTFQQTQNSFQRQLDTFQQTQNSFQQTQDSFQHTQNSFQHTQNSFQNCLDALTIRVDAMEDKLEAVHQSQINMENVLPLKVAAALDGYSVNKDKLDEHGGRIDFLERKADIHDLRLFALEQPQKKA